MMKKATRMSQVTELTLRTLLGICSRNRQGQGLTTIKISNIVNKRWGLSTTKEEMGSILSNLISGGYLTKNYDDEGSFSVSSTGKYSNLSNKSPVIKKDTGEKVESGALGSFIKKVFGLDLKKFSWMKKSRHVEVMKQAIAQSVLINGLPRLRELVRTANSPFTYLNKISYQYAFPKESKEQGNRFATTRSISRQDLEEMVGILFDQSIENIDKIFREAGELYTRCIQAFKKIGKAVKANIAKVFKKRDTRSYETSAKGIEVEERDLPPPKKESYADVVARIEAEENERANMYKANGQSPKKGSYADVIAELGVGMNDKVDNIWKDWEKATY